MSHRSSGSTGRKCSANTRPWPRPSVSSERSQRPPTPRPYPHLWTPPGYSPPGTDTPRPAARQWSVAPPQLFLRRSHTLKPPPPRALAVWSNSLSNTKWLLLVCQGKDQVDVCLVGTCCHSNLQWHPCMHTLALHGVRGGWHLSWVEGCCQMCFTSSVSHQPQQTGPLSGQPFTGARDNKLSTLPNLQPFILHPPFLSFS